MNINIAWWNCKLSPPLSKYSSKVNDISIGHAVVVRNLLQEYGCDIVGLCEVNSNDISQLLLLVNGLDSGENYVVLNLYEKDGNAIDDYCLIYNKEKFTYSGGKRSFNTWADITGEKLKAGLLVELEIAGGGLLNVVLAHWQSRITYAPGSEPRRKLGATLRASLDGLFSQKDLPLIVVLADFNDEPFDASIQESLKSSRDPVLVVRHPRVLYNPFWNCLGSLDHGRIGLHTGSCIHGSSHEMSFSKTFDQILLSSEFLSDRWEILGAGGEILHGVMQESVVDFSLVSDHYPVISRLIRRGL